MQANFPEQGHAQAGLLIGYISQPQPARWGNFGSFAKVSHGKFFYSCFLLFLEQQRAHRYYSLKKDQQRTTLSSTTSDRQRARVKHKNVCKSKWCDEIARKRKHIHVTSTTGTWTFCSNAVFNHFPLEDFSQTNLESINQFPKSPFPPKTQNRQIARTSLVNRNP